MLENVNLDASMGKEQYKTEAGPLKERLSVLQHEVKNNSLPVVILFEGWNTAGKGRVLSDVILTLDPRNFKAKSTLPPTPEQQRKPFLWRHWCSIPEKGIFAIYDKSWYPEVSTERAEGTVSAKQAAARMEAVNLFERQMADDGALILKFFLHIGKKEQRRRLDALAGKKSTAWRVDKADYANNKNYGKFLAAYEDMLVCTGTEYAPWHLVPAHDFQDAMAQIYAVLVDSIEKALAAKAKRQKARPTKKWPPLRSGFSQGDSALQA